MALLTLAYCHDRKSVNSQDNNTDNDRANDNAGNNDNAINNDNRCFFQHELIFKFTF